MKQCYDMAKFNAELQFVSMLVVIYRLEVELIAVRLMYLILNDFT